MSVGMFSIFPVPQVWGVKSMNLVIPFFPVVGAMVGLIWWALSLIISGLPPMLTAALLTIAPFVLSGFLHLDGYLDTCDAILSRRSTEKKRKILKDPHIGAFAVIMLAILFLLSFTAFYVILEQSANLAILVFIPILSRAVTGLIMLKLKPFSPDGYATAFGKGSRPIHQAMLCLAVVITLTAGGLAGGSAILIPLGIMLMVSVLSAVFVYRQLGGISGDLCGFIITVGEFSALLTMAVMR